MHVIDFLLDVVAFAMVFAGMLAGIFYALFLVCVAFNGLVRFCGLVRDLR